MDNSNPRQLQDQSICCWYHISLALSLVTGNYPPNRDSSCGQCRKQLGSDKTDSLITVAVANTNSYEHHFFQV